MVESHWEGLGGRELSYGGHSWELTGDVAVLERGDLLAVQATQTDDVRRPTATLHFGLDSPSDSLNPGNLGEFFESLETTGDGHYIVVKTQGRTYRYELHRLQS